MVGKGALRTLQALGKGLWGRGTLGDTKPGQALGAKHFKAGRHRPTLGRKGVASGFNVELEWLMQGITDWLVGEVLSLLTGQVKHLT